MERERWEIWPTCSKPARIGLAVDEHAIDVLGQKIAHRALDDVGLKVQGGRGLLVLHLLLDLLPCAEQEVEVADEIAGLLALAGSAHDDAHAFGNGEFVEQLPEALAFLDVLDLAGDAALIGVRHQDQEAARQGEIGRRAGPLGADRALGDLDDDLSARRVEAGDVFDRGFGRTRDVSSFRLTRTTSTEESAAAGSMSQ